MKPEKLVEVCSTELEAQALADALISEMGAKWMLDRLRESWMLDRLRESYVSSGSIPLRRALAANLRFFAEDLERSAEDLEWSEER